MRRLAASIAGALVLGACSTPIATAPPPPDGVVIGGEATISLPRPASLDPGNLLDRTGEIVLRAMCDPLLDYDRETGEYRAALLDSWVITDAGTRLVLRLRSGLTFPDGTPVTSRDAIFGISRAASADFAGENSNLLAGIAGYGALAGFEEAQEPRHRTEFAGIRILSDTAFEINLNFPAPVVLPILTNPISSPLSKVAAEADPEAFEAAPVCVGPYQAVEPFDPSAATFAIERVENYPGVNEAYTGGGQGYLDRITFHWTEPRPASDPNTGTIPAGTVVTAPSRYDAFDVVELDPLQRRRLQRDQLADVVTATSPHQQYIGLPPDAVDLPTRVALSQALNRRALADDALDGRAAPATTFLPPSLGTRLHDPKVCGDRIPASGDVARARQTLEDAGISLDGTTIPLVTNPDFDNVRLVQAVASQWRAAFPGLIVEVATMPWEQYAREHDKPEGFNTGFRTSRHVPFPGADAWLRLFWSGNIGLANAVGYENVDLDELLNFDTGAAIDPVDQAVLHREAEQMVCDDLPLIPVVMDQRHFSIGPGLASATGDLTDLADPITGGLRLRELHRR